MENSRGTHDGLLALSPNERPFVLTRASYAGGQRYAATWTGDNSSTWNHLRLTIPQIVNLGLSGFAMNGADVGGFAGTPQTDLLTKWIEIAAFQPIDRDHTAIGTGNQEPWVGGPAQEAIRRRFINERYRLMPYLYTLADETSRTGLPIMRPVFLDYPRAATDGHPIDIDASTGGEFLLGHDLLIAPSPYPEAPDAYTVELPTPDWYDYWTGKRLPPSTPGKPSVAGIPPSGADLIPLTTSIRPELDTLPVFVRGGAILPIAPLTQSTAEIPQGPLTLRLYAGPDCRGSLYLDDGHTYAYTHGDSRLMTFTCNITPDALTLNIAEQGTYKPWWKDIRLEIYGWQPVLQHRHPQQLHTRSRTLRRSHNTHAPRDRSQHLGDHPLEQRQHNRACRNQQPTRSLRQRQPLTQHRPRQQNHQHHTQLVDRRHLRRLTQRQRPEITDPRHPRRQPRQAQQHPASLIHRCNLAMPTQRNRDRPREHHDDRRANRRR